MDFSDSSLSAFTRRRGEWDDGGLNLLAYCTSISIKTWVAFKIKRIGE
jgi:hypothetical protein